jgi:hypothetical protein
VKFPFKVTAQRFRVCDLDPVSVDDCHRPPCCGQAGPSSSINGACQNDTEAMERQAQGQSVASQCRRRTDSATPAARPSAIAVNSRAWRPPGRSPTFAVAAISARCEVAPTLSSPSRSGSARSGARCRATSTAVRSGVVQRIPPTSTISPGPTGTLAPGYRRLSDTSIGIGASGRGRQPGAPCTQAAVRSTTRCRRLSTNPNAFARVAGHIDWVASTYTPRTKRTALIIRSSAGRPTPIRAAIAGVNGSPASI